ncbi:MAG TPA: alpha/beta hydrolase [Caproiciproducens sp.]|nr:alpha/beta hydrolase [Caproiciproducens sp.]
MKSKVQDVSVSYEVIGQGKPIVMIHGYFVDHRMMTGCMEPVFQNKNNYKRIYFDLPGMGDSDSSDWITNADRMLEIVIGLIDRLIPNQNFLLAGYSYGGYLARGIVCKMPQRVDGLALLCPVIRPNFSERDVPEHIVLEKDSRLLAKLSAEKAKEFNEDFVVQNERTYERYQEEILSGIEIGNNEFLRTFQKTGYAFSFPVDKLAEKFEKPALILVGRQDSCVGYRDAWDILENYTRATFAALDYAGHNLQIEQQELFESMINEWLARTSRA